MSVILIFLSILTVILGFVFPSSKKISYWMYIWMWVLFAFNTNNADYANYLGIYSRIGSGTSYTIANYETGFVLLCRLCNRFGLDYSAFLVLVATVTTIMFAIVIRLYCAGIRRNIVISIFLITLYWINICQYRNYIAFLIVMIGLYYYLYCDAKRGTIIFLLSNLLAFSFHRSSVLFLLLLLVKPLSIKKCFFAIPISMIPFILLRNGSFYSLVNRFVPAYKINGFLYNDSHRTFVGVFALVLVRILLLIMEFAILNRDNHNEIIKKEETFVTSTIKIMILSFAFLALEAFDPNYERLFRVPLMLSMVLFAQYGERYNVTARKVPLNYLGLVGFYALYMVAFYVSNQSWFYSVLIPVLTNNRLIGT